MSPTPHLVPQPVSFNLSGIPNTKTSRKDTNSEAEGGAKFRHKIWPDSTPNIKRTRQDASITWHSLQLMAEEFRELKIQKHKGGYSPNTMLVLSSWLKYVEICIKEQKITNLEAVQLVKDYITESARDAVEFYLNTNSTRDDEELIKHLRTSFKSGKTFSSLVRDFYTHVQKPKETEDQFADELQILDWNIISVRLSWKDEVNEALKHNSPSD